MNKAKFTIDQVRILYHCAFVIDCLQDLLMMLHERDCGADGKLLDKHKPAYELINKVDKHMQEARCLAFGVTLSNERRLDDPPFKSDIRSIELALDKLSNEIRDRDNDDLFYMDVDYIKDMVVAYQGNLIDKKK